ncbi:Transcriptional regulator, contains XRE-family HTH domain [Cribrihabitans marinus]|uniref:Transcriptional regulator, contains XRE-family HTH domain n=1 Tax=Cribrihabitans marinus TaxID=1227549 RepID=A0A1H7BFQ7_9RHOB|nr:XRE family transcriptional regulator [Cribrihabitans marinus]GGH34607.1 Cro/Cl family transcriptional regulator [Cribrihabitans marinus]SEJ76449.1 Transcriptional regulator, contains XRE-family HTH domain [Cribrihabitans marinus]
MPDVLTERLAAQLRDLRCARGLTLDGLAALSGISRATLSRIETAEVSPTAEVLNRLAAAHGVPPSRLLMTVEESFTPRIPFDRQTEWTEPNTGRTIRAVSPSAPGLQAEIEEGHLPPDSRARQEPPARPGRECHLVLLDGALTATIDGVPHALSGGDCLRYHLAGPAGFETGPSRGARYLLVTL